MRFKAWLLDLQRRMDRLSDRLMGVQYKFFIGFDWASDEWGVWTLMTVHPNGDYYIVDHGTIHYETEPLI